ncbi:DUF3157 family protein [Seonamhaeicola maritimus]|uniref:DUF3157 family protein n=1 Tax=Seonamhaeicola maritimus TaxID=2591822 RepID=A0A5C7GH65_9FLAO|nr:DUF3157 family protein [Seonamhaeicola maritimus]
MKSFLLTSLFFISFLSFSQDNHIVKTEDGRRVLLKADFTWEYIDLVKPKIKEVKTETTVAKTSKGDTCKLAEDFVEPKLDKKIQTELKKGRATIIHVKKKVAKDNKCEVEDVILLSAKESKASGIYHFCANGTKVVYKRSGHSIAKKIKLF